MYVLKAVDADPAVCWVQAPTLRTLSRSRPPLVKSREEEEAEAIAALPKFKARPFK
jgi:hypothetical protein